MDKEKQAVPQHQVFTFDDDSVIFRSDFDSGNLGRAEKVSDVLFNLWTGPDCMGTQYENTCRTWFFFHVSSARPLSMTIKNLNLQGKLFREGMRPVLKTPSLDWHRFNGPLPSNVAGNQFEITITYDFPEHEAYFAFTYPWSYEESLQLLDSLERPYDFYFHRELLIKSLDERRCDILTISSLKGMTEEKENTLPHLFPGRTEAPNKFTGKPIVFISARVHPGETPASHVMNGFLRFIVSDDPRAVAIRDEFVFKIVPMINPDGVYRGHYRTDTQGLNLNRYYNAPVLAQHPTIYAIREIFMHYHNTVKEGIYCYIDLHAHASKRAVFVYGNYMDYPRQIETCMLAKLLATNCANFDFEGSNFTEKNMVLKDKRDGMSKEGSGRVALYKLTNLVRCYTLECNYNAGHVLNKLNPSGLPEEPEANTDSEIYANGCPYYTIRILEDVGLAIGVSLLDSILKNPYSRILPSDPTLRNLRYEVGASVAKIVPFRFDSQLKKSIKSIEGFEEYVKNYGKPRNKKPPAEEKKVVKKKAPIKPSRIITQKTEEAKSLPASMNHSSASSSDSYKSLEPKPKDVKVLPLKNFEFVKPVRNENNLPKVPERGRRFGNKKHSYQLSSLNRHENNVRKFREDYHRTSSIPVEKRIFPVVEVLAE